MVFSIIGGFVQNYIFLCSCVCIGAFIWLLRNYDTPRNVARNLWHYLLSSRPFVMIATWVQQNFLLTIFTFWPRLRRRKVQILDQVKTRVSCNFSEALKVWINDFECVDTGIEDVDVSIPLIVVCPKTSRLKPDVELAINNLPRSSDYALIILHPGPERNLPVLPSRSSCSEYKNTIIDMGFDEPAGIYPCSTNDIAKEQLKMYVNQFKRN